MLAILLLTAALGLLDFALTAWGLQLGIFAEANPIIAALLHYSPALGYGLTVGLPLLGLALIWHLRDRSRMARPALWGLFGVRVAIIAMHAAWIAAL